MLTQENDVEIHALARRGWWKSAIARHTGRDRKTIAKYLAGQGPTGEPAPSCLQPFRAYLEARLGDDPHVRGSVLFEDSLQKADSISHQFSQSSFARPLAAAKLFPTAGRRSIMVAGGGGPSTIDA
jgi:transposase